VNNKRERYLTDEEARRLFKALEESKVVMLKYIITMLMLTGARKSEVVYTQWKDIDAGMRLWRVVANLQTPPLPRRACRRASWPRGWRPWP
jgi:integrase